ncbi:hypothetical protein C8R44DRAFT_755334 [Mycena epipterygia]|nr:hypothetical protein C8R44DRAFT_755334 [Mycena epipterygia]
MSASASETTMSSPLALISTATSLPPSTLSPLRRAHPSTQILLGPAPLLSCATRPKFCASFPSQAQRGVSPKRVRVKSSFALGYASGHRVRSSSPVNFSTSFARIIRDVWVYDAHIPRLDSGSLHSPFIKPTPIPTIRTSLRYARGERRTRRPVTFKYAPRERSARNIKGHEITRSTAYIWRSRAAFLPSPDLHPRTPLPRSCSLALAPTSASPSPHGVGVQKEIRPGPLPQHAATRSSAVLQITDTCGVEGGQAFPIPEGMSLSYWLQGVYVRNARTYELLGRPNSPKSIVILEAREMCSGATGRNTGHCKPDQYCGFGKYEKLWRRASQEAIQISRLNGAQAIWAWKASTLYPWKLVAHMMKTYLGKGLNLQTWTPVTSFTASANTPGLWDVNTERGAISTPTVVFATNADTSSVLPSFTKGEGVAEFVRCHGGGLYSINMRGRARTVCRSLGPYRTSLTSGSAQASTGTGGTWAETGLPECLGLTPERRAKIGDAPDFRKPVV